MSNLDGITFYGNPSLEESVLQNLISFFKYGLLELGAFVTIATGQLDYQGYDQSKLQPLFANSVANYRIYRGSKHDWVWENDVNLKYSGGTQPTVSTGVYVNGTLATTGGYYVDFSRGQVVFANAQSSSATIQIPHTLRGVQVYPFESNEFRQVAYGWNDRSVNTTGIADYSYKAYLPAIFVRIAESKTDRGLELGSRAKLARLETEFHIFAANPYELRKLSDICYMLEEKGITLYDIQGAPKPLDYYGRIVNQTGTYPVLTNVYGTGFGYFQGDAVTFKASNNQVPLHYGRVSIGLLVETYPV